MEVARQARGEERRLHILRTTLDVIERHGVDAVTHRAVGEASGVPLGSVTYYFPSKDGLLRDALELWVAEEVERLGALAASIEAADLSPRQGATRWSELLSANDPHQVAQFELYLQAARTPELRDAVREAFAAYERVAVAGLRAVGLEEPESVAALFVALADGMGLRRVADPDAAAPFEAALVQLFEALGARRDAG
jgi:DNA-binding transcriptional regulator YbjK